MPFQNFDGVKLILPKRLDEVVKALAHPVTGEEVVATIRFKRVCGFGEMGVLQHYNILFGRVMKILKFNVYNRKFYNPKAGNKIPVKILKTLLSQCDVLNAF